MPAEHESPADWTLQFSFKSQKQVTDFIRKLIDEPAFSVFSFSYDNDCKDNHVIHTVTISSSWSGNLETVTEILKEVDLKI